MTGNICIFTQRAKYANRAQAVQAGQRVSKKPAKSDLQVFKCLLCAKWHYQWVDQDRS